MQFHLHASKWADDALDPAPLSRQIFDRSGVAESLPLGMHKDDGNRDGKALMPTNHHLTYLSSFYDGVGRVTLPPGQTFLEAG